MTVFTCRLSSIAVVFVASIVLACPGFGLAPLPTPAVQRREALRSLTRSASAVVLTTTTVDGTTHSIASAATTSSSSPPSPSSSPRLVDVGGGIDLFGKRTLDAPDVVYPVSLEGVWAVQRVVTSIEGDTFQAEMAWRGLGGQGASSMKAPESFLTRFIRDDDSSQCILDRKYEYSNRSKATTEWEAARPDMVNIGKTTLFVVQRKIEPPSEQGFGFNEFYGITDGPFERAARVQRRYRRAFDDEGNRVIEGLEIMKTYRVLDGVAGAEMPTSTTKSVIRMTRPPPTTTSTSAGA